MSSRRTKKEKQKAKHQFLYTWDSSSNQAPARLSVNRQKNEAATSTTTVTRKVESAEKFAQVDNLASERSDIIRSLVIALIIISFEVVLYFVWN